jgi:hypothetical protein
MIGFPIAALLLLTDAARRVLPRWTRRLSPSLQLRLRWATRRILAGFRWRAAPGEDGETE